MTEDSKILIGPMKEETPLPGPAYFADRIHGGWRHLQTDPEDRAAMVYKHFAFNNMA